MENYFVEYLLGTLDPVTHHRVQTWLEHHPEGQVRLALLEQALAPLAEDAEPPEPPAGLALVTLARVAEHRCKLPTAPRPSAIQTGAPARRWARRIDWLVAACLLLVVSGLTAPLLARLWHEQQRMACANNLRKFWVGLQAYADRSDDAFPRVEPAGPRAVAGIFVPVLADSGVLPDVSVDCPAQGHRSPPRRSLSELEHLYRESPVEFRAAARELAGHYAYSLGYEQGGNLYGLRRDSGDGLPILADRPTLPADNSPNHGGRGQNVLYVGGQVRWAVRPTAGQDGDNIFVNQHFRVRAGVCRTDSVLAGGDARPYQVE